MHEHHSRSLDSKASREHIAKLLKKVLSEEERSTISIKTEPSKFYETSVLESRDEYGYKYAKSRSGSNDIRPSCDSMIESDVSEDSDYPSNFPEKNSASTTSKNYGKRTTESFSKEIVDTDDARRSNKISNLMAISGVSSSRSGQSRPISASSSRRSSQSSRSSTQPREGVSFVNKERSPFVSVVKSNSDSETSAGRSRQYASDYSTEDSEYYNIFDRLHSDSMEKNEEGRSRREEIERKSIAFNKWRRGDDIKPARKITKEQGTKLYYYGMVHMVHMERKIAERAEELDIPFSTRLNLEQMIKYYHEMEKISELKI